MATVSLSLLFGFLAVALAQQEGILIEDIVNDVIKPNDGLFSNVVEQFGIVSFSPTPSATTSMTPSVSPSASVSSAASVFAPSSPRASNSALPSRGASPTPSSSTGPSSSVSPTPSSQGRRPRAPRPLASNSPQPSASTTVTPSPSPSPQCPEISTITLPASGYENLRFEFRDRNGGEFNFDITVVFNGDSDGGSCFGTTGTYVDRYPFGSRNTDVAVFEIKRASDDGVLDSPKELVLTANSNEGTNDEELVSLVVYTYNGRFQSGDNTSEQLLSILGCCTSVTDANSPCATDLVATVQISKNPDDTITLSATQNNPQFC